MHLNNLEVVGSDAPRRKAERLLGPDYTVPKLKPPHSERSKISAQLVHNRIHAILAHTTRYAFKAESRLANDSGISPSALNRVVKGQASPSFALVSAITRALELSLCRSLNPHEIISLDGTYPTQYVCEAVGCSGCLPDWAYDESQMIRPEWRGVRPGCWSGSVPPGGARRGESSPDTPVPVKSAGAAGRNGKEVV